MSFLRVVATPIGNLEDITIRALRVLKEADYILCEDTRITRKLLDNYQIKTPTISYHQHSQEPKVDKIVGLLKENKNLALVTDAGTPGISDPGANLISAVRATLGEAVTIESVPGPSALAAALSVAGAGFERFLFLGFPPHKKGRQTMLKTVADSAFPIIFYESKHRILKLLAELAELEKSKKIELEIFVARELTKLYESFYSGAPASVKAVLEAKESNLKGEFVVLVRRASKAKKSLQE